MVRGKPVARLVSDSAGAKVNYNPWMIAEANWKTAGKLLALLLGALAGTGCVQRTITVNSQPSQALVYLNDKEVGRTPVTVPFTFYGTYDVRLEHEGYDPLWTKAKAAAPWWEYPGPDLLAEAVPWARSRIDWHFEMDREVPPANVEVDPLQRRARQLRRRSRQ